MSTNEAKRTDNRESESLDIIIVGDSALNSQAPKWQCSGVRNSNPTGEKLSFAEIPGDHQLWTTRSTSGA
jgi:hypothetical protein